MVMHPAQDRWLAGHPDKRSDFLRNGKEVIPAMVRLVHAAAQASRLESMRYYRDRFRVSKQRGSKLLTAISNFFNTWIPK
jgi:hypothetical protein